jgi:alkanesulfonate monooxygenase SsuD/methylene tetrahydromethanopterin reductase-like flavin-dependent oxidoreductase (luciferase family)
VLAKSVVTVDHVSGGRAELGIGAGWYEAEHETYGFPFPPLRERMDELDRQIETVVRQWTENENVWPKPVQRPRPTLLVGGGAKPRTVRAAVRWADEYNTVFATPDEARERRATIVRACEEAGREPLRFSLMTGCVLGADQRELERRKQRLRDLTGNEVGPPVISGTVEQAAERLREYDLDRVMLQHLAHEDVEMVALMGEVQRLVA